MENINSEYRCVVDNRAGVVHFGGPPALGHVIGLPPAKREIFIIRYVI
jgi:hypothetical protein